MQRYCFFLDSLRFPIKFGCNLLRFPIKITYDLLRFPISVGRIYIDWKKFGRPEVCASQKNQ